MKTTLNSYPTVEQLRALEAAAHRARAREIARLVRAGAGRLKWLTEHLFTLPGGGRIGHA